MRETSSSIGRRSGKVTDGMVNRRVDFDTSVAPEEMATEIGRRIRAAGSLDAIDEILGEPLVRRQVRWLLDRHPGRHAALFEAINAHRRIISDLLQDVVVWPDEKASD